MITPGQFSKRSVQISLVGESRCGDGPRSGVRAYRLVVGIGEQVSSQVARTPSRGRDYEDDGARITSALIRPPFPAIKRVGSSYNRAGGSDSSMAVGSRAD